MAKQFKYFIKLFLISYPILILTDLLWSGLVMQSWYQEQIKAVCTIADNTLIVHWPAAFVAWGCILFGSILFVLPRITPASYGNAFVWGALYGTTLYGMYHHTNLAILTNWGIIFAIVDTTWGILLSGLLACLLLFLDKNLS